MNNRYAVEFQYKLVGIKSPLFSSWWPTISDYFCRGRFVRACSMEELN
ncbi:hypothetical protein [Paenibacillus pabuli]